MKTTKRKPAHFAINTRIYRMWQNMLNRCRNTKVDSYKYYGAKGIAVCAEWHSFENFYNDMIEGYADNLSLDRKENDKGYYKENCRWVTMKVQQSNRTNNFWIESNGTKKILLDWARELNIQQDILSRYIKNGYSIEQIQSFYKNKRFKTQSMLPHKPYIMSPEGNAKMGKPCLGKFGAANPASKKVIDTSSRYIYGSVSDAANAAGLKITTLVMMLKGKNPNKTTLKYL